MFMSLLSHAVSAWFAFLWPSFSTFKALSHRPLSEPELQRWTMYWAVVGAFVGFEYLCEWLISWFPFYWEAKAVFLLYLALPQTEGSTYIYTTYFQPFLAEHEKDLDAGIISIQSNTISCLRDRFVTFWESMASHFNKASSAGPHPAGADVQEGSSTGTSPWSSSTTSGLWRKYGSSLTGMLQPTASARTEEPTARYNEKDRSGSPSGTPPAVPNATE